jgi:hypothetical protein
MENHESGTRSLPPRSAQHGDTGDRFCVGCCALTSPNSSVEGEGENCEVHDDDSQECTQQIASSTDFYNVKQGVMLSIFVFSPNKMSVVCAWDILHRAKRTYRTVWNAMP